jgi:phosphoribosylaminoimidazole-succinocarboxamide synthase
MSNLDIKKVKELVWISEHPNEMMDERVECLRVLKDAKVEIGYKKHTNITLMHEIVTLIKKLEEK